MSAIDQAFARAYSKQPQTRAAAATVERTRDVDVGENGDRRILIPDGPHAEIPAPHAHFTKHRAASSSPGQDAGAGSSKAHVGMDAAKNDTHGSFVVRPAFEVDQFAWPETCRQMLDRSQNELNRLARWLHDSDRARIVYIAGCRKGEGRTTLLLSLALMLAGEGRRVALLDADFAGARLAEQLGVAPQIGMEDVLADDAPAAEAMIESVGDGVTLVPLRQPEQQPPALSRQPRLAGILAMLSRQFDFVLVAGRPLCEQDAGDNLRTLTQDAAIETAVLVHDRRATTQPQVRRAAGVLEEAGIASLAVVENFADSAAPQAA